VCEREGVGGGHVSFEEFRKNKCEKISVFFLHISKRALLYIHPAAERKKGRGVETRSKGRLSPKQLIGEQETDRAFFYET
jgi:hypothetical protein